MLKIIDIYIIKKFLATFFLSILMMVLLIIVIDLSDKLGRFIDEKIPIKEVVFNYYLSLVPFYLNLFLPLFVFISIIFFTSKMATKSEIIAILSSGTSFWRLSYPYLLTSLGLAILSFILGSFIIPPANKNRILFETVYINRGVERDIRNIHRQIEPGKFIYIKYLDKNNVIGHDFTLEEFEDSKLKFKLSADNILWDSTKQIWVVNNYIQREIREKEDLFEKGISKEISFNLQPKDLLENIVDIATLNIFKLDKFIENQRLHGNKNLNSFLIERHKRYSMPFATFILALIGLTLSSKKIRGGTGLQLGIGIALSLIYILMQKLTDQWATLGSIPVFVAVWLPNFLYIPIIAILYRFAPK